MIKTSAKIVFFGTEDFSLTVLRSLLQADYDVVAVVTKPDSKKGRGQQISSPSVKKLAQEYGISVLQPTKLVEIADTIESFGTVTGVLVSYGKIVPQSIIELFTPGIINVHPSLLPKYRGPSPIESAIINGDKETGVTIMLLSAAMDAGPIYRTETYPLNGTETQSELYEILAERGAKLLLGTLPDILEASLTPIPQDNNQAEYCQLLKKTDGYITPISISATHAEKTVRAHLTYPKTKLTLFGYPCIITKTHVSPTKEDLLSQECQDGLYLCIDELIAPSGRRMSGEAFQRGYNTT